MLKTSIEKLNTGYFATVMATGITSIALLLSNYSRSLKNLIFKIFNYILTNNDIKP